MCQGLFQIDIWLVPCCFEICLLCILHMLLHLPHLDTLLPVVKINRCQFAKSSWQDHLQCLRVFWDSPIQIVWRQRSYPAHHKIIVDLAALGSGPYSGSSLDQPERLCLSGSSGKSWALRPNPDIPARPLRTPCPRYQHCHRKLVGHRWLGRWCPS